MRLSLSLIFGLSLSACGEKTPDERETTEENDTTENEETETSDPLDIDDDGDGLSENEGDCDDTNAAINPSAAEICDGVDNDCDELMDDEDNSLDLSTGTEHFTDADGDSFGDSATATSSCIVPNEAVTVAGDCDDADADINPDAVEICDGGIDNDCDELMDDEDDSLDLTLGTPGTFYSDNDNDGEGDPEAMILACEMPAGTVINATDCNDEDPDLNTSDDDNDGLTTCGTGTDRDCDDDDAAIGATDVDADGSIACEGDCDDTDPLLNVLDTDNDGYTTCEDENGLADCNDDDENTFPGAGFNEVGFDAADYSTYECLTDADGDGYGFGQACYTFTISDSNGDGWSGGFALSADGTLVDTASISETSGSSPETTEICVDDGQSVSIVFEGGRYAAQISGEIFVNDLSRGTFTGAGGSGTSPTDRQKLTFDGVEYNDADEFIAETAVSATGGTDFNDNDSSVQ